MPILASNIFSLVRSALDAEGSEYYTDQQDLIPAINSGQSFLIYLINAQLGAKKFAEEYYRELIKSRVWQSSIYSRVDVTLPATSPLEKVWSILSITVEPELNIPFVAANVIGGLSVERPDLLYVKDGYACGRLTMEEWVENAGNPFMEGYTAEPNTLNKDYAYLTHVSYANTSPAIPFASPNEIEIRPPVPSSPVVIAFVKLPTPVQLASDNLDFPESMTDLLVKATLREIAFKQGDRTTISSLSTQDMMAMLKNTL